MSSADQPYIDPSEIALEGSAAERFKNPNDAFWAGIRDAAGAPAMVLFAGMVGFGAMGKTNGFMFGLLPLLHFSCSPYQGR